MKSVILCEGGTDLTLLQYYLEKVHDWEYDKAESEWNTFSVRKWFKKDNGNKLLIGACGGVGKVPAKFGDILDYNSIYADEGFDKIIIVTDRDEYTTVSEFNMLIKEKLINRGISIDGNIENNKWEQIKYVDELGQQKVIEMILLVIPFEEKGALETFLLNALSYSDDTEKKVINQCNAFVDNIDTDGKYLKNRRYITKAKFDVYFSIRTPLEQFRERRNILRSVNWEEYTEIQIQFKELEKLG